MTRHPAEKDAAPIVGHGPYCEWDEDMARMWCGREHLVRMATRSRLPRFLRRIVWHDVWRDIPSTKGQP